ncbi:MAG TPA: RHS repeat-associated core domain-containing protein [Terrimicrobiaceae bacterium]|nr:RHS repeat-associated core domain-containing protein [Terrimicrobiaceae bacterium]
MKTILSFACVVGLSLGLTSLQALPPDLDPPPAAFGDADRDGTLLVTDDLREADFGGGLRLPVRWVYRSNDASTNAYGWNGFSLTMLEAKAVKKNEHLYEVTFLCGKVLYFNKQGETDNWKSNDGQWTAVEDEEDEKFNVTSWDNWRLEFVQGRIKKLITEDNRTLLWTYDGTDARLVVNVREVGEDPVVVIGISDDPLEMAGSSAVRGAHTLTVNGDAYTFKYAGNTLKDIEFPDGRKTQWRFENNGSSTTEKRLTLTQPGGFWRSWVFFDESRRLKTDDTWNYSITGGEIEEGETVAYGRPTMQMTRIATSEVRKVEYESSNAIEIATDVLGNVTKTFRYKATGMLYDKPYKIERKRNGESSFTVVWRGSYNSTTGDLLYSFDADDNETSFVYERFSGASLFLPPKKVTVTDPLGRVTVTERDENGDLIKSTNSAGVVRKYEYDSRHRLTKVKNVNNDVLTKYVYGDKDEVLEKYDALNNKVTYEYIVHLGRPLLKKATTPEGRISEWMHDSRGRVVTVKKPSGSEWEYTYSSGDIGMADKITDPLSGETEYVYDSQLNAVSVEDPLDREVITEYDDLDLPVEVTNALSQVTHATHNAQGSVASVTDARGKIYTLSWETAGARKKLQWPDAEKQENVFNAQGQLVEWKALGGTATISNVFNDAGEVASSNWIFGSESGTSSATRNSFGQITGASATTMSLSVDQGMTYDAEGRLASLSQTVGDVTRTAGFTYDLNGSLSTLTYPKGFVIEYLRNDDGQVTAIKKGTDTLANYTYDSAGRVSEKTLGNGVVTSYSYDAMSRITQIMVTSGSTALWAERYGYNAAGERIYTLTGETGTAGDAYWLDNAGQLRGVKYGASGANGGYSSASSPVGAGAWNYDAAGNRSLAVVNSGSTSYTVNDVNQYTAVGAATPTYNARGDLATHGDWEYTYDASGNLIRAHNTQSNVLAKYWRDASGQRAVKDVDGEKEIFFNSGPNLLEVYDVGAESALSYVYEPGVDRPLAQIAEDGTVQYFHQDILGSVRALTNAGGAIVQTFTYSVWGEAVGKNSGGTVIASSQYASRWLFTGRQYDAETGLYHFRARAYSTELGRFLQNDPADFDGGDLNLFRYCLNSPLDLCDPFGLAWTLCTTAEEATDLDTAPTSPPPPGPNGPNNPPPGGKPGTKIFDHSPGNKGGAGGAGGGGRGTESPWYLNEGFVDSMENISNFAAGMGDGLTMGFAGPIRDGLSKLTGLETYVNESTWSYTGGLWTGRGVSATRNAAQYGPKILNSMINRHTLPRGSSIPR